MSLGGGVLVLGLKWVAYRLTGSVALYSDALESIVNIAAALALLIALHISARPPDADHPYGHGKAEYFSAAFEGTLIGVAAIAIVREAWGRLQAPTPLARLDVGLALSLVATAVNAGMAAYLISAGKRHRSPALRADGLHLWTDVATSVGVLAGTGLAGITRVWILDPVLAMLVAVNIVRVGIGIVRDSVGGLMDEAPSAAQLARVREAIARAIEPSMSIHALRSRRAAARVFVDFHLVVPGAMAVRTAHEMCDRLELRIEEVLPGAQVNIHVEPDDRVGSCTLDSEPPGA
jgi:cation diffusion facilitator family transporter